MTKVLHVTRTVLLTLLVLILVPFFLLHLMGNYIYGYYLKKKFNRKLGKNGKNIVFVYSNSPNWQDYVENNIIPKISKQAVLLNWSERHNWKKTIPLEAKILYNWGGSYEFNPIAIIFLPNGKVKTIRFFKAFKEFKHGNKELLDKVERELYEHINNEGLEV